MNKLLTYLTNHITNGFFCGLGTVSLCSSVIVLDRIFTKKFKKDILDNILNNTCIFSCCVCFTTVSSTCVSMLIDPSSFNRHIIYNVCGFYVNCYIFSLFHKTSNFF